MKKRIFSLFTVFILTILISACSIEDSSEKTSENIKDDIRTDYELTPASIPPSAIKSKTEAKSALAPEFAPKFEYELTSEQAPEPTPASDVDEETRIANLREDIEYLREELPKKHKNPFSIISKEEFNERLSKLYNDVDKLDNNQVFIEIGKIVSSIRDGHTGTDYFGWRNYPLQFYIFNDEMYIIDTDDKLKDMLYSKIISIDNVAYTDIVSELTQQIPYENKSWLKYMLAKRVYPSYLYGLGISKNGEFAMFEVEKDGEIKSFKVPIISGEQSKAFLTRKYNNKIIGKYKKNYEYKYVEDEKVLYFEYNSCKNMEEQSFKDFNAEMFKDIESKKPEKIIIDLRANVGGHSELLNPFTNKLKEYIKNNEGTKVYVLSGRQTFSSGMYAIFRIRDVVKDTIFIGEPSGGALDCYGAGGVFHLPNSQLPIQYSAAYFKFTRDFGYEIKDMNAFIPNILCSPSIENFIEGRDIALEYALND